MLGILGLVVSQADYDSEDQGSDRVVVNAVPRKLVDY